MPRIIEFQGRRIEVPDAATDDMISEILQSSPAPAAPQAAAPTMQQRIEDVIGAPTSPMASGCERVSGSSREAPPPPCYPSFP